MLPPFVPPSARVPREELPLITEFVVTLRERSFESAVGVVNATADLAVGAVGEVAVPVPELSVEEHVQRHINTGPFVESLPSITDFLVDTAGGEEVAQQTEVDGQTEEVIHAAEGEGMPALVIDAVATADRGEIAADSLAAQEIPAPDLITHDLPAQDLAVHEAPILNLPTPRGEDQQLSDSGWVNDERNAFDWQAMATLASKQDEEHKAKDEWASTNWDSSPSDSDHVAAMLIQVARRVKSGELAVAATRGMTTEATLAATLMALLQTEA